MGDATREAMEEVDPPGIRAFAGRRSRNAFGVARKNAGARKAVESRKPSSLTNSG